MTEGTGHVIDPAGDARRALQEAVSTHGPTALSDATVMDNLCRTQLTALPGECILIVSAARADVPLTGELRFHDYLAARAQGLALVVPGHYATERCGVEELAERLRLQWPALEVWSSRRECDPATWL